MYAGKDPLTGKERYERETATTYQDAVAEAGDGGGTSKPGQSVSGFGQPL